MKIGIFTDTYFPQINGVVTSTRMLEKELNKLGHTVYIFTVSDPNVNNAAPRVFRLPSMPFVFMTSQRVAFLYSPKLLLNLKKLDLDIIHTQTEFPLGIFGKVVSEFYKIPMVHTYHTMYEDYVHYIANGHLITPKMAQQFSRIFCNRARAVIAPTDKTKNYLLDIGVTKPVSVIPTGLDFEPFKRGKYSQEELDNAKKELNINLSDPLIVSIGRVAKEKSIDVVIQQMPELLKKMPNAKLLIVGDGPKRKELQEQAAELGIGSSVIFAGFRPWETIGKYYQLGDVFVTASTSETQGLTYIEALAAKTPVVVKKDKSVEGLIKHGETGYCFERDEDAAELLYYVLSNKEAARRAAEKGYETIDEFSSARFAKNVLSLYEDVIAESLTPSR